MRRATHKTCVFCMLPAAPPLLGPLTTGPEARVLGRSMGPTCPCRWVDGRPPPLLHIALPAWFPQVQCETPTMTLCLPGTPLLLQSMVILPPSQWGHCLPCQALGPQPTPAWAAFLSIFIPLHIPTGHVAVVTGPVSSGPVPCPGESIFKLPKKCCSLVLLKKIFKERHHKVFG